MIRSLRIGVGCLLGLALTEMLAPLARAFELRELREQHPESFEPAAALASVLAAIEQDGLYPGPSAPAAT